MDPLDELLDRLAPAPFPPRADISIGPPSPNNNPLGVLPPEIRCLVILEAFGNRTLHMDLIFEPPPVRLRSAEPSSHVNYKAVRRNALRPSAWEWWGWGGHNGPLQIWDKPVDSTANKPRPADDLCGYNGTRGLYGMSRPAPGPRFIGVLGWLLSCREAYLETVNVLYGNNTLHIARTYLFLGLSRLFMPERLAAIRDVELLWDLRLGLSHGKTPELEIIRIFFEVLPRTLPNLKRLYLSFQDRTIFYGEFPRAYTSFRIVEGILLQVDSMVARLSRLVECRVAFPTTVYAPWKYVRNGDKLEPDEVNRGSLYGVWRDLPGNGDHRRGSKDGIEGYWVCHGMTDEYLSLRSHLERVI